MKKFLLVLLAALFLACPTFAQAADDDTDVGKLTCADFLKLDKNDMTMMLMWIDGYMSAESDNTVMSKKWMEKLGTHMGSFCAKNSNKTIMQAIEAMPEN